MLEVISTLLLNFVAEALVSLMVQGPLQERTGIYPQSDPIADAARLPLLPGTRLHLGFVISLVIAAGLWFYVSRTLAGFRLLAAGTGPRAAALIGRVLLAYEKFVDGEHVKTFADLWNRSDLLRGKTIGLVEGGRRHHGVVAGLDDDGALLLREEHGKVHRVRAGEVTLEKQS